MGNFTLNCLDFTISGASVTIAGVAGPPQLNIYGSFSIVSTTVWSATQIVVNFVATTTGKTINTNGVTVNFNGLNFNGVGGAWTLSGALTTGTSCTTTLTAGSLDIAGFTLSTGLFSSNNSNTRSIAFGAGFIALTTTTAAATVLQMSTLTNFSSTGTGGFSSATNVTKTFSSGITAGGSQTTGPSMFVTAGAGVITLNGASYWNTLSFVGSTSTVNATGTQTLVYATNLIFGSGTSYFINVTPTFNMTVKGNTKGISGTLNVNNAAITFTWDSSGGLCSATTTTLSAGKIACTGGGQIGVNTSGTMAHSGGQLAIDGCTWRNLTYTYTGGTITDTGGGTIGVSDNVGNNGTFTLNGPTLSLPLSPTSTFTIYRRLTINSGTLSLTGNVNIFIASGVGPSILDLVSGSVVLNNYNLQVGSILSSYTSVRSISFGTGNIYTTTTNSAGSIQMADLTNFTRTGTGGIGPLTNSAATSIAIGSTASGSITNAPSLIFTSGSVAPTIATGSWINKLDYGGATFTQGTVNLNLNSFVLGGGVYTSLTATMRGTGTITTNGLVCILVINNPGYTTTMAAANTCGAITLTAGTLDLAGFTLTQSSSVYLFQLNGGSLLNIATMQTGSLSIGSAFTFTVTSGMTITQASGSSTSVSGTFNYNGGSFTPASTFSQVGSSTVTLGQAFSIAGTYTLTGGTLNLNGFDLTTSGGFSSSNTNARIINFGANNILTSIAAGTIIDVATATNFSWTGTGGFISPAPAGRTFVFGTTGGSVTNAPNLSINSGGGAPTLTTGSWFKTLNFTGNSGTPTASTINVINLILSDTGIYTNLSVTMVSTGTITSNVSTLAALTINHSGTTSLSTTLTLSPTGLTTLTNGTLNLNGFNLTTGRFASTNSNTRSITFGSNNIILATTSVGQVCLDMSTTTNFSWTGTGGFTSAMSATRTFQFGTTGGSSSIAPNLTLTSGSSVPTFTTGSWFNKLDFSGTTAGAVPLATVNVNSLTLASGGNYANLTVNVVSTGTIISNGNTTIITLNINAPGSTVSAGDAFTTNTSSGGITLTAGTFNLNGYNPTIGAFVSTNTNTRSVSFGTNTIILTLTSGTCLQMGTATNFTCTGTGGFSVASGVSRGLDFGSTAGGTESNSPNITVTGSGAGVWNLTGNSWYNKIDFGTSAIVISTLTLNLNSITASTSVTYTGLTAVMRATGTIISNGRTFGSVTINSSGTTTLGSALTTNGTTTITAGTLNLAGFTMTTSTVSSSSSSARSITGAGTLVVTGSWSISDGTNFTGNNYTINMTSASGKTFDGAGGSYGNLVQAGAGALTISGSNQLNNISATTRPSTISFTAGTTQTLTNFTLSGTAGNLVTINSVTSGTQFNLLKTSDTVNVNYLTISDSNASAAFFANTNSTNSGNNTGWNFTAPAVVQAGFAAFF
jgi:hypothetical protein